MKEFGEKIKELREERKLTQKELAKFLNIRNTTISAWEQNIAEPPYETLKKLCLLFDVSSDYLLGLEDESGARTATQINNLSHFNNSGTIKF